MEASDTGLPRGTGPEADRLQRARAIFFAVRELSLEAREVAIDGACEGDEDLREVVLLLLRGESAPMRIEGLADEFRAAAEELAPTAGGSASSPNAPSEPGTRVGRYRLLERIGEGGFGVVFAAEQTEPVKRRVALKIIKLGMDTRQVVARFEAERQALALMDHPNIAKVFDAGATATGRPYFVMELVRGLPITEYCDTRRLSIAARLELFTQVCDAVQHAHQKGVIHRDIKPSNIIVGEAGDRAIPKVIDFGIAKATSATLTEKTIFTEVRQMIGTPEYMSPEQASTSALEVDTRTDVYALGVVLYELLVGATPFDAGRLRSAAYGEIQRIIREEDPPRPSARLTTLATLATVAQARGIEPTRLGSSLRGELDWVVMKCLEKDRNRRYESAGSLRREVGRYMSGEAVQAVPPSAAYQFRKFVRRHKGPVIAGLLVVLVLVAGLIGTSLGFFNAERQRKTAVVEKARADESATQARSAEAAATRLAYTANMLSACDAISANQTGRARSYLASAPEALRGWEWRLLQSRLDVSTRVLAAPAQKPAKPYRAQALIPHPDGRSFFSIRPFEAVAAQRRDLTTGEILAEFAHPAGERRAPTTMSRFSLSTDGSRLFAIARCADENSALANTVSVSIWDLLANTSVLHKEHDLPDPGVLLLAISPDGARLLLSRGTSVWQQDVETGATLASAESSINADFGWFNRDGSRIVLSDDRGGLVLVDGLTLDHAVILERHRNMTTGAEFSMDGRWLATSSLDDTARVWDLNAAPPTYIVLKHPQALGLIGFSPDASQLATGCGDGGRRVWNARTGELACNLTSDDLVGGTMFMPDGHTVAAVRRDGSLCFWDVGAESTVTLRGHQGLVTGAVFAERPGLIVTTGWDGWNGRPGCIRLWDAETGVTVASLGRPGELPLSLAVSPDGRLAATTVSAVRAPNVPADAERTDRVQILDLEIGRLVVVSQHADCLAFDPSGEQLATGKRGRLEVRGARDGSLLRNREAGYSGKWIQSLAWSPDGRFLACALDDFSAGGPQVAGEYEMLDSRTLETVRRFDTGPIAFTSDSKAILLGSPTGTLSVLNLDSWETIRSIDRHALGLQSLVVSPDGSRFVECFKELGEALVCRADNFDRIARFQPGGFLSTAAWSADSARLVAACDRAVYVWDSKPLRERVQLREDRRVALDAVEPMVVELFDELKDPAKVVERIKTDGSLSPLDRKTSLQVALRIALESYAGAAPSPGGSK